MFQLDPILLENTLSKTARSVPLSFHITHSHTRPLHGEAHQPFWISSTPPLFIFHMSRTTMSHSFPHAPQKSKTCLTWHLLINQGTQQLWYSPSTLSVPIGKPSSFNFLMLHSLITCIYFVWPVSHFKLLIPQISKSQHPCMEQQPNLALLKWNQVRCIMTWNWTFWLGIVLDHCTVHTCANDIMLTDRLIICSSILTNGWLMYNVMDIGLAKTRLNKSSNLGKIAKLMKIFI